MPDITVTISDTEKKCLQHDIADDLDVWADAIIKNKANVIKSQIITMLVAHCNENDISIATGVDAQITQAYDLGIVKTAKDRLNDVPDAPGNS